MDWLRTIHTFRFVQIVCVTILVTKAWLPEVVAAERDGKNIEITINLFDAVAVFPPPSWQVTPKISEEHEMHRQSAGNQFILEFIPKGESFESWTKMHAVYAIKTPRLGFDKFVELSIQPFRRACGVDNLEEREVKREESSVLLMILCTDSPEGPSKFGYGEGIGEVTLMWLGHLKETKIKVYQHWRGDAYSADDADTWPVGGAVFSRSVDEFKGIRMIGR